ncbi:hypothetical protein HHI36_005828 [Cryptolaemus montrouzieri]|uniref:Uncharacterized protein n=1 Tax=Cryptolaemus montrouzieri TaxID=559131 RepID=A0ABD2NVS2_9CUCU
MANQDKDLQEYEAAKNLIRRLTKTEKNNAWDQHCQQIETLIRGKRYSEVWNFIRSLKSSNKDKVHISIFEHEGKIITPTYFRKEEQSIETNPKNRI